MSSDSTEDTPSLWVRLLNKKSSDYYSYDGFAFFSNITYYNNGTEFDSRLVAPEDVSPDAVLSSLLFNTVVCVFLLSFYECLRRILPTVYSSHKKKARTRLNRSDEAISEDEEQINGSEQSNGLHATSTTPYQQFSPEDHNEGTAADPLSPEGVQSRRNTRDNIGLLRASSLKPLPDDRPLDWVFPVFGVSWNKVRKIAGLDGYFFLRYIRMNVRITAVSTFWFFLILVPIYATGGQARQNNNKNNSNDYINAQGWYHFSAANLPTYGWKMWIPCVFFYLFTAFIFFVVQQEYKHFLEIRQDFLAKGTAHVNPQHHYSLMIENIPYELRSDKALKEYFDKLFPGKVHSASVVLKVPDLEEASSRCLRSCRRLEKSIALFNSTGKRPTHIVGRGRLSVLGVDLVPVDCARCCCIESSPSSSSLHDDGIVVVEDGRYAERPARGTRVDSISYYTQELAAHSRALFRMQQRKMHIAHSGNLNIKADNWLDQAVQNFSAAANRILDDSALANDLISPNETFGETPDSLVVENMHSHYGSFGCFVMTEPSADNEDGDGEGANNDYATPFGSDQYKSLLRRWAGRIGLDFVVYTIKAMNSELDLALEGVIGATMSSTGFVTFLDLSSTTCAASAPLSVKANVLNASVAPEPRDIRWENAHVSQKIQQVRERTVNIVLFLGVILWSFPLAAIQAFAKAKYLVRFPHNCLTCTSVTRLFLSNIFVLIQAQFPGMEWIETFHGGTLSKFVNGYLPVVALLGLILILPVIFEYIAVKYEHRKTFSDIQASMLGRYFYYQVANVYVSVTAGSLLKSLAGILDRPSMILQLLGESLPTMVGYFVALLVTKILAGLPMIFLRFGALSRMLLLKTLSDERKLTQRELDAVYRLENVQYGWEFPTQLLVVVIVFTYAIICPVILPFGFLYFLGALMVYKKQVLYVYSPVYESGGAMFPTAVQRTLFGLVCGQMTMLGYLTTRGCFYQLFFLSPLPIITLIGMNYFYKTYAEPSTRLSLERARECDRISSLRNEDNIEVGTTGLDRGEESRLRTFDRSAYRQPVLTELAAEPWTYRRGVEDEETVTVRNQLRHVNRYVTRAMQEQTPSLDGISSPI